MVCNECGTEAIISESSKLHYEGDTSAETETKAYRIFKYGCRNPNCKNHRDKVVLEEKKVYID